VEKIGDGETVEESQTIHWTWQWRNDGLITNLGEVITNTAGTIDAKHAGAMRSVPENMLQLCT
jgi:hypothetical protein